MTDVTTSSGGEPALIAAGTTFSAPDLVHLHPSLGPFDTADLGGIDVVVTGPHASAALPAELAPFLDPRVTRRLQFDFTDVSTSPLARRLVQLDPRVAYVEDPHPRAVRDANRPRPVDPQANLREAFARIRAAGEQAKPDLAGVDSVRPVTFAGLPFYREPTDEASWDELAETLTEVAARGVDVYESTRDDLVDRVIEAKLRAVRELDRSQCTAAQWRSATTLHVLSLHDTMNRTAGPDGAIARERPEADRLPPVVALSNRGDAGGGPRVHDDGTALAPTDVPSMDPDRFRALAAAHRLGFGVEGGLADPTGSVVLNRPYLGGHETTTAGPRLAGIERGAVVRSADGDLARLRLGAYQAEFLREHIVGAQAAAELMAPGVGWVEIPEDHLSRVAGNLAQSLQAWRDHGPALISPNWQG